MCLKGNNVAIAIIAKHLLYSAQLRTLAAFSNTVLFSVTEHHQTGLRAWCVISECTGVTSMFLA